ncbi:MAG: 50S ribosomal protein L25 [Candidatus Paceibacterota bacterium]|jgi:large subunit ribosomal protein L25
MKLELKAEKREIFGEKTKEIREAGLIPAELYGHGKENEHLSVLKKDFDKVFKEAGENTIIYLSVNGVETPVLVYDFDKDAITGELKNIDFYRVKMDEKVTAEIPFVFKGESPAVQNLGGILVTVLHNVEVEALPADLPHSIEIDITALDEIGKSVHIKDLNLPKGVEIKEEMEAVIITVKEQKQEKEEETGPADVSAVEVVGEKKEGEEEKKEEKKS